MSRSPQTGRNAEKTVKRRRFWRAYAIFTVLCLAAGAALLFLVDRVVREYDAAQPELVADRVLVEFRDAISRNTLPDSLAFPPLQSRRFEENGETHLREIYQSLLRDGGDLSYRIKTGAGSDLSKVYTVFAGDAPIATLTLAGSNSRNKLFFFSMADWEIDSLEPILTASLYSFRIYLPEGIRAFVNEQELGADERIDAESGIPVYAVRDLTAEPALRFEREDGTPLDYRVEHNEVTPILYHYAFQLPDSITVTLDGEILCGEDAGTHQRTYVIASMSEPEILLSDYCGNRLAYHGETDLPLYRYTVTLPETCALRIGDTTVDPALATRSPHPDAEPLSRYAPGVSLPELLTWEIPMLCEEVSVTVTDAQGKSKDYPLVDRSLRITRLGGSDSLPVSIAAQVDPMEIAVLWSKFMTNDLSGAPHGFPEISPYLVPDSDAYRSAYTWATSESVTIVSVHTITGFTGQRLSNVNIWSDRCFSCEIYLEKNMNLYDSEGQGRFAGYRTDVLHSTFYFVEIGDTSGSGEGGPHWAVAFMRDVLEEGKGGPHAEAASLRGLHEERGGGTQR